MFTRARLIVLAAVLEGCSAPDLSLASEEGCDTVPGTAADCGTKFWHTRCAIPVAPPWNRPGCFSPDGKKLSTTWCCKT
jgi:hypothetical protein